MVKKNSVLDRIKKDIPSTQLDLVLYQTHKPKSRKIKLLERKTLELDILNTDCWIWISTLDTFDFCLIRFFSSFRISLPDSDQWEFAQNGCSGFCRCHSDWLDFRHFPGYKLKIKNILILQKEEMRNWSIYINNSKVFSSGYLINITTVYSELWQLRTWNAF